MVRRFMRRFALGVVVFAAVSSVGAMATWGKDTKVGQAGSFTILRIDDDKGKFDRCAAHLNAGPGVFRLAWNRDRLYTISVPSIPNPPAGQFRLTLDLPGGSVSEPAKIVAERTFAIFDGGTIEKLMGVREKIAMTLGTKRYEWTIGNTKMDRVVAALESCMDKAQPPR